MRAESELGTFRESGGLWEKYNIEEVATPEAWERDPAMVTEFYNMRRKQCYETSPNAAHYAIAELEKQYRVEVITQNINEFHVRTGSTQRTHIHHRCTAGHCIQRQSLYQCNNVVLLRCQYTIEK